jgi:hypothetical protein
VHHVKILNFKLKMIDPNCSIYSLCQTLVENQTLYFYFFFGKKKLLDLKILDCPIVIIFFLSKK